MKAPALHARLRGFTLVELLVAVAIALGVTLAITLTLIRSESSRRTLTAANDTAGNAAYLSFTLDRLLRSAGSGLTQAWRQGYGCPLQATRAGLGTILPRATAYPAPFASVTQTLRLAPLVVHAGVGNGGSDVLIVQSGAAGLSEAPMQVLPNSSTGSSLRLLVTLGLEAQDLMLLVQDNDINDAPQACVLQQVATGFSGGADQQLPLGGTYAAATVGSVVMSSLATDQRAWALPLGNATTNRPSFVLLGVSAQRTLVAYDLLRLDGTNTVLPLADGVVDLRARYGVDTDDNGTVDAWVSPAAAGWTAATLFNGSVASRTSLSRILSVRVALVLRDTVQQTSGGQVVNITPASLTLFNDLPAALQATHNVTTANRPLRHQIVEFTVPLRNAMLTQRP
jgi:type IV pilus assembly protein PilW